MNIHRNRGFDHVTNDLATGNTIEKVVDDRYVYRFPDLFQNLASKGLDLTDHDPHEVSVIPGQSKGYHSRHRGRGCQGEVVDQ
jgi:hypothetical protein